MKNDFVKYILISLGAALLFIPFLGQVNLFDWDEINFSECAREMLVTKNYLRVQIDYQPFWEKPPLFIWMQALCMGIFGINEFAARLPNAVIGMATFCCLFYIGKKIVNERMAWWWVLLYAGSWLPHFYFKTAIIDPTFNLFIFLSFYQIYLLKYDTRKLLHALLSGFFLGLAVLTKGPVALLIALICLLVYLIQNKGLWGYRWSHFLWVASACLMTTFLWFGIDIVQNGWWFTREFISYQIRLFSTEDAGHGGPFFYHFIVLMIGCFPAVVFLFQSGKSSSWASNRKEESDFAKWMWILLWVTLLLFSIVKTKIVHYSSLCYFPITFLAALQVGRIAEGKVKLKKVLPILLIVIGGLWALILILLPIAGMHLKKFIPYIDDAFAVGNMQAQVTWSYWLCLLGTLYLIGIIISTTKMKHQFHKGLLGIILLQILAIQGTMLLFTPRIEAYSQRAAIEFYESKAHQDVYVHPLGYKSYAHLFYTRTLPNRSQLYNKLGEDWLLHGQLDKPAFFIIKNTSAAQWDTHPNLERIGAKNGFIFYRRR